MGSAASRSIHTHIHAQSTHTFAHPLTYAKGQLLRQMRMQNESLHGHPRVLHWFIVRINYAAICQTLSALELRVLRPVRFSDFSRFRPPHRASLRLFATGEAVKCRCAVCRLQFTSPKRAAQQVASNCRWQSAKLPDINVAECPH